ncbi:hypothetical protein V8C44DRAFT_360655 [Trichoderma aethiopicum]
MSQQTTTLTTSYTSPTNPPFTTSESIPAPPTPLDDKINAELTARMEEDKKREEAAGLKHAVDDEKEEENYGEEVQGEEE